MLARDGLVEIGPPRVVLFLAMAVFTIVFGRLVVLRHQRFGTFDFDLGIYDQAVWLLAHGHGFDTVRGLGFRLGARYCGGAAGRHDLCKACGFGWCWA